MVAQMVEIRLAAVVAKVMAVVGQAAIQGSHQVADVAMPPQEMEASVKLL